MYAPPSGPIPVARAESRGNSVRAGWWRNGRPLPVEPTLSPQGCQDSVRGPGAARFSETAGSRLADPYGWLTGRQTFDVRPRPLSFRWILEVTAQLMCDRGGLTSRKDVLWLSPENDSISRPRPAGKRRSAYGLPSRESSPRRSARLLSWLIDVLLLKRPAEY